MTFFPGNIPDTLNLVVCYDGFDVGGIVQLCGEISQRTSLPITVTQLPESDFVHLEGNEREIQRVLTPDSLVLVNGDITQPEKIILYGANIFHWVAADSGARFMLAWNPTTYVKKGRHPHSQDQVGEECAPHHQRSYFQETSHPLQVSDLAGPLERYVSEMVGIRDRFDPDHIPELLRIVSFSRRLTLRSNDILYEDFFDGLGVSYSLESRDEETLADYLTPEKAAEFDRDTLVLVHGGLWSNNMKGIEATARLSALCGARFIVTWDPGKYDSSNAVPEEWDPYLPDDPDECYGPRHQVSFVLYSDHAMGNPKREPMASYLRELVGRDA